MADFCQVELHGHIRATHATLGVEDIGAGPELLFLHGYPATRRLWAHVAPELVTDGYRALIPDLVGYGDSRPGGEQPVDLISRARWLLEMLNAAEIEHVIVIAHDVGSAAAQLLLHLAPDRVQALVILDGAHAGEEGGRLIQAHDSSLTTALWPIFRLLPTHTHGETIDGGSYAARQGFNASITRVIL